MYLVTGGGTGIGRAVALRLHEQGKEVMICGRRSEPLAEVLRLTASGVRGVVADCGDPGDVARLAEAILGRVDGWVHCAGGNPAIGRPDPATLEEVAELFDETFHGNARSVALVAAALRERWADQAAIVLVGSIAAEYGVGHYGPAKAAVASYAVGLAKELGPQGVRVNCVSPGYIADTEFFPNGLDADRLEALRQQTALGRTGVPADVVALVEFLLSPGARHITGQNLHLNGGAFTLR